MFVYCAACRVGCVVVLLCGFWCNSEQLKMYTKYMPWAIETGRKSTFLLNVYYEKHFEDNLDELRASLDITPPPS